MFIGPPSKDSSGGDLNQAIPVSEADETNQALRLLGQSIGIIALGKRIVLIEGDQSSLDKQAYGSIIRNDWPSIVLVPSGGKHVIESFASIYDAVLSKTIWGVDFLMLCDGDSAPTAPADRAYAGSDSSRLRVLPRYHLENYFLDERVWVEVFTPMEQPGSWLTSADKIHVAMRDLARELVSYSVSLAVSSAVRLQFGEISVMPKMCHGKSMDELKDLFVGQLEGEQRRYAEVTQVDALKEQIEKCYQTLVTSINEDTEDWKRMVPGKPLLSRFVAKAGLMPARAKTLYIAAGLQSTQKPFDEIQEIFRAFAEV